MEFDNVAETRQQAIRYSSRITLKCFNFIGTGFCCFVAYILYIAIVCFPLVSTIYVKILLDDLIEKTKDCIDFKHYDAINLYIAIFLILSAMILLGGLFKGYASLKKSSETEN